MLNNLSDNKNFFWNYSLAVYQKPNVSELCLQWQDTINADVNLILFAGWLAKKDILFSIERVQKANAAISEWRESVIEPLRNIRKTVNNSAVKRQDFYEKIKNIELAAEFEAQELLFVLSSDWQISSNSSAIDNLSNYLLFLQEKNELLKNKILINPLASTLHEENKKLSI